MRVCLFVCLFVCHLVAWASQPVAFNFDGVPLMTFARAVYGNMLHRDFVILPDVVALDRKITMQVKSIAVEDIPGFVEKLLLEQGVKVTARDSVVYLTSLKTQALADSADQPLPVPTGGVNVAPQVSAPARETVLQQVPTSSYEVYSPQHRRSEYLAAALGALFGASAAKSVGPQLVISGVPEQLEKIHGLLHALDVDPHMVDVSASWVEVTETDGQARGISLAAKVLGAKFGVAVGDRGSSPSITLQNANFDLVINALNSDGRFKQISNSRLVGDDADTLALNVGDDTPTLSSSGKDNAGNQVQNIIYRQSGVIVDVQPRLLGSGRIHLVIDGQISSFKATANGVSGSPTLIRRQVKTAVTVGDGDVLVIGGLTDTQSTVSKSAIPFLPASWAAKETTQIKTDLVLILTAKAVKL